MTDAAAALEAIHAYLDENPGDLDVRRELADLLQDEGRHDEADHQRWLAGEGKWPGRATRGRAATWHWYSEADPIADSPHVLPADIHGALGGGPRGWDVYPSREKAEADLLRSLHRLDLLSPGARTVLERPAGAGHERAKP